MVLQMEFEPVEQTANKGDKNGTVQTEQDAALDCYNDVFCPFRGFFCSKTVIPKHIPESIDHFLIGGPAGQVHRSIHRGSFNCDHA